MALLLITPLDFVSPNAQPSLKHSLTIALISASSTVRQLLTCTPIILQWYASKSALQDYLQIPAQELASSVVLQT
jgi:hypothetical protein